MNELATVDLLRLVLLGGVGYLGLHHLWSYLTRRDRADAWVGAWCAAICVFLLGRYLQQVAETPDDAAVALRVLLAAALCVPPLTMLLCWEVVGLAPTGRRAWLLAGSAVPVLLALTTDALIDALATVPAAANPAEPGLAAWAMLLYGLAVYVYCERLLSRVAGERGSTWALRAVVLTLLVGGLHDLALAYDWLGGPQIIDVSAAVAAMIVGYALVRRSSQRIWGVERAGEARRAFVERVIDAQESERKRLSRELHDATGQSLTSLLVRLRALEDAAGGEVAAQAAELREVVKDTLEDVRRMARGLHPIALDDLGFEEAARRYADEFGATHDMAVDVHVNGLHTVGPVPQPMELVLYRILQEGLTNVARHAQAHTVSIVITRAPELVRMIIEDDGRGFDVDRAGGGMGLLSMRERAALCGGSVTIESSAQRGTTVYVVLPLDEPGPVLSSVA